jgi:hypothetical protein
MNPICGYCNKESKLVTGKEIYPHRPDLFHKRFYSCMPCGAYVGCHPGSIRPLGRLANKELRNEKLKTHSIFDPIWKSGKMSRASAYKKLSKAIGIKAEECHVGMFTVELCKKAQAAAAEINTEENRRQNIAVAVQTQPLTAKVMQARQQCRTVECL